MVGDPIHNDSHGCRIPRPRGRDPKLLQLDTLRSGDGAIEGGGALVAGAQAVSAAHP